MTRCRRPSHHNLSYKPRQQYPVQARSGHLSRPLVFVRDLKHMKRVEQANKLRAASVAYRENQLHLAFDLYSELADAGHAESQIFIGWMLSQGIGCKKTKRKLQSTMSARQRSVTH